jgi:hypothetical protein
MFRPRPAIAFCFRGGEHPWPQKVVSVETAEEPDQQEKRDWNPEEP